MALQKWPSQAHSNPENLKGRTCFLPLLCTCWLVRARLPAGSWSPVTSGSDREICSTAHGPDRHPGNPSHADSSWLDLWPLLWTCCLVCARLPAFSWSPVLQTTSHMPHLRSLQKVEALWQAVSPSSSSILQDFSLRHLQSSLQEHQALTGRCAARPSTLDFLWEVCKSLNGLRLQESILPQDSGEVWISAT